MENVSKIYGSTVALQGLNLEIFDNELLAIIGPSGAGKSTLIKVISGEQKPTSGRILHSNSTSLGKQRSRVAIVYQNYSLFPHMNALENVRYPIDAKNGFMSMLTSKKIENDQSALEFLKLVQLADKADRMPDNLSGGEQQRVAIARALAMDPHLICFDEPLSSLDDAVRGSMKEHIASLKTSQRHTMLYVTHRLEEAYSLADRVAVLIDGKVHQIGTPQAVYHSPVSHDVAMHTGRINQISGQYDLGVNVFKTDAGFSIPVSKILNPSCKKIGIRPEFITVKTEPTEEKYSKQAPNIQAKLQTSVFEGAHTLCQFVLAGNFVVDVLCSSLEASKLKKNNTYKLEFMADQLIEFS